MLLRDPIFCTTYNQKRFPPVSLGPPLFPPPPTPSSLQSFNPRKRISDLMQWKSKKILLYDNTKDISRFGIELSVPHDTKGRVTVGMSTASPAIELQSAVHRENRNSSHTHGWVHAQPQVEEFFFLLRGVYVLSPLIFHDGVVSPSLFLFLFFLAHRSLFLVSFSFLSLLTTG